ncbi:MAG: hypothetical protein H7276_05520 [Caulobacter sp.]|nr:hypothetical protein [Vitreoscilla sp.]
MPRPPSRPDPAQLLLFEPDEPSRRARMADRLKALLAPAQPATPDAGGLPPASSWPDSFFDTGHAPLE